jgi:large subunit ribosomal protein L21
MKKAVISTGSKQYLVTEGQTLEVELLKSKEKSITLEPLLLIDGDKTMIGAPLLSGSRVSLEIIEASVKGDKVTAIRYKAKKRVHKVHGHRQEHTVVKVSSIK